MIDFLGRSVPKARSEPVQHRHDLLQLAQLLVDERLPAPSGEEQSSASIVQRPRCVDNLHRLAAKGAGVRASPSCAFPKPYITPFVRSIFTHLARRTLLPPAADPEQYFNYTP